jgi:hypothetical protein
LIMPSLCRLCSTVRPTMSRKSYKIPVSRLARVMETSRDCWKQRAAQKQRTIRSLRVNVRDLRASRDRWKSLAREAQAQLQQLDDDHATAPAEPRPGGACLGGP